MSVDAAALQIAIILLPGVIWALMDANYGAQVKRDQLTVIIRAVLFGLTAYAATYIVYDFLDREFTAPGTGATGTFGVNPRFADELLTAVALSVAFGIGWLYAQTYRWASRFLRWIKATNRYGDEDVWDHTLNSRTPEIEYVNVRHFERKLVYGGYLESFSSSGCDRELLLRDVSVYDLQATHLYDMPRVYLAFSTDAVHIEFPYTPDQETADVVQTAQHSPAPE